MVPWTDHSAPEGLIVVPLNETELALTSSIRAVIPVKPVTTPASKLTVNPILLMACGLACSSAFIVPSHDSVRTSASMGEAQINAKAINSIRDMGTPDPHMGPMASAYQARPKSRKLTRSPRWTGSAKRQGVPAIKYLGRTLQFISVAQRPCLERW